MQGKRPPVPPVGASVVELPHVASRLPACPAYLTGTQRAVWTEVTKELVARQTYDGDALHIVVAYCIEYARFLDAEKDISKRGTIIVGKHSPRTGSKVEKKNPFLDISNNALDRIVKLSAELGLSPASRKRVTKVKGAGAQVAASKYLERKRA